MQSKCFSTGKGSLKNKLKYKAKISKEYNEIPKIECYSQELNQVFINLLTNAAQSIENQGKIGISDTGCGIAEENLSRIFDPFFTTKEVGKGTGLGMSISYNIIKDFKGSLSFDVEDGVGTTFRVTLPAA